MAFDLDGSALRPPHQYLTYRPRISNDKKNWILERFINIGEYIERKRENGRQSKQHEIQKGCPRQPGPAEPRRSILAFKSKCASAIDAVIVDKTSDNPTAVCLIGQKRSRRNESQALLPSATSKRHALLKFALTV